MYWQINIQLQCPSTKMVRTSSQILFIWQHESFHHSMYPIVNIIYSTPAMNTHSKKRAIPNLNLDEIHDWYGALNTQFFFALPNTLDNNDIFQLMHQDTIAIKKNNVRKQWMRQIRKREKLVKLKRELRQVHKLSRTENGFLVALGILG